MDFFRDRKRHGVHFWETPSFLSLLRMGILVTTNKNWSVVLNIFYFHPYLGKWSNLTNIFQRGWNHQLENHRNFYQKIWVDQPKVGDSEIPTPKRITTEREEMSSKSRMLGDLTFFWWFHHWFPLILNEFHWVPGYCRPRFFEVWLWHREGLQPQNHHRYWADQIVF